MGNRQLNLVTAHLSTMSILQSIRRAIRGPIIRFLAGSDLIVVGDIYCSKSISDPLITVSSNQHADLYGNISAYDGPTVIVPRGCKPLPQAMEGP
jgi:hypothetical protein